LPGVIAIVFDGIVVPAISSVSPVPENVIAPDPAAPATPISNVLPSSTLEPPD
jgi:hypothetical protein